MAILLVVHSGWQVAGDKWHFFSSLSGMMMMLMMMMMMMMIKWFAILKMKLKLKCKIGCGSSQVKGYSAS